MKGLTFNRQNLSCLPRNWSNTHCRFIVTLWRASQRLFNLLIQMSGNSALEIFLKIRRLWWRCCPCGICSTPLSSLPAGTQETFHLLGDRRSHPSTYSSSQEPSLPLLFSVTVTLTSFVVLIKVSVSFII